MNPNAAAVPGKALRAMPDEVWCSALTSRPGAIGQAFRTVDALVASGLTLAVMASPLMIAAWFVTLVHGGDDQLAVAGVRNWSSLYSALVLASCIGYRVVFELEGCVPRLDKEYPLLPRTSIVPRLLLRREGWSYPLGWVVLLYAALLWLSWWQHWLAVPNGWHTLAHAIVNTVVGIAALAYAWVLPWHGYRRPEPAGPKASPPLPTVTAAQPQQTPVAAATPAEYATPVQARQPRLEFGAVHGMSALKRQMIEAAQQILMPRTAGGEPPRNGILLHGEPGNGKTIFAEALAGELGLPFVAMTYGDVASKWIGEMPRVIANCFAYAKQQAPCVFLIDEVDSFVRSRDMAPVGDDLKVTNTMLTEIVRLRHESVVLVAATNYLSSLDTAAIREGRFDYKVEVTPPDETARLGILTNELARRMPGLQVDEQALHSVAKRWAGFSASRLVAVAKALAAYAAEAGAARIGFDDWMHALRAVQGRAGAVPASSLRLSDLFLDRPTQEALQLIVARLGNVHACEQSGGTLPGGILFHGPSGTGKTVAAQALACECGWAFLAATGPDLMTDRDRMNKLYRQACDLRPALVFVDEADDVLRDRRISAMPDLVNRLLALMDGASARVPDVVFIAATNHPEQIDPALMRPGRFEEKIAFGVPPADQLLRAVQAWTQGRAADFADDLGPAEIARVLDGRTIADVRGVLQYALNRAIARRRGAEGPQIQREDLRAAIETVLV